MPRLRTIIAGSLLALIMSPMLFNSAPSTGSAAPGQDWDGCIETLTGAGASAEEAAAYCFASFGDTGIALATYQAAVAVADVIGDSKEAISETTDQATEWTADKVEQSVEKVQNVGERVIERLVDKAEAIAEKADETGEAVVERTTEKVEAVAGKIEDWVGAGAERLVEKAETVVERVATKVERTQRGAEQIGEHVADLFDEDTAAIGPVGANLGPTATPTLAPVMQGSEAPSASRERVRVVNPTPTRTPSAIRPVSPVGPGIVEPKTGVR